MDIIGIILNTLLTIFIIGGALIGLFIFILISKYNNKVTLKIDTATGKRVKITRAKDQGNGKWKLLYKKILIIAPPEEAIEIDEKGKLHATVYLSKDGTVSFQLDDWKFREIPEDIKKLKLEDKTKYTEALNKWEKEQKVIPQKPFTPHQKAVLIEQEKKREEWKQKGALQLIRDVAPLIALVLMFTMLLVFYGSVAEPVLESGERMDSITQKQAEITQTQHQTMEIISNLIKEKQIISGKDIYKEMNDGE